MLKKSFDPVADFRARVLVLGSLPGDASLARGEYYAYKQNVFWKIMGDLLYFNFSLGYDERLEKLRESGVALWDVVGQGDRPGSLDSNISGVVPNNLPGLLEKCPKIECICCNGGTAWRLLKRHFPGLFEDGLVIHQLPSTSPAAAGIRYEEKLAAYREAMRPFLNL